MCKLLICFLLTIMLFLITLNLQSLSSPELMNKTGNPYILHTSYLFALPLPLGIRKKKKKKSKPDHESKQQALFIRQAHFPKVCQNKIEVLLLDRQLIFQKVATFHIIKDAFTFTQRRAQLYTPD